MLGRLPDLYRVPMLVYVDGFATKEVAAMTDAPLGTVLARLHRGRKLRARALGLRDDQRLTRGAGPLITCTEAVKQLWDYLDGALPDDDRAAIEEHLSFCRRCCGEVEFAEELRGSSHSTRPRRFLPRCGNA